MYRQLFDAISNFENEQIKKEQFFIARTNKHIQLV